jgi:DNA-binding phage protein
MSQNDRVILNLLLRLKEKHGNLNRALVRTYVMANGRKSIRRIALETGLSRDTVERALEGWPKIGH